MDISLVGIRLKYLKNSLELLILILMRRLFKMDRLRVIPMLLFMSSVRFKNFTKDA